ncbi:uncharacterized protein LOC125209848 [Salvia hispanica]|uniref:uncharacterized protein LOC125209848 n=1 Tax=Salvia hispanica TaxID=49212 RepID=UPI0020091948|nr:uncharacterized protein LOC125209848 [Salvia hispanica]
MRYSFRAATTNSILIPLRVSGPELHHWMEDSRDMKRKEMEAAVVMIEDIIRDHQHNCFTILNIVNRLAHTTAHSGEEDTQASYNMSDKMPAQVSHMNRLTKVTDVDCIDNLRMDRNAFGRLCRILRDKCGLVDQRYVRVEEQVAMFLSTLAHHTKNRVVGFQFLRSKHTVSRYIHEVMRGVIHLHRTLFVQPTPVDESCDDARWKWFKGCLGALDGTYINVRVSAADAPRYRSRKGEISTNTLVV